MHSSISAIEYFLPEKVLTTEELSTAFPEWNAAQIDGKTGITNRHIADESQCASDLALIAAQQLFSSGVCDPASIDFLLLCTQSPDYLIPTTACLLQSRLGIPVSAGALDVNLGCSGFVYGLGLAEGLIASEQARSILLITADTYSKYVRRSDKTCRTIFGDGAAATLVTAQSSESPLIGPFVYGTDGRGGKHLILANSGARRNCETISGGKDSVVSQHEPCLFMDGHQLFTFAVTVVPDNVRSLLRKAGMTIDDVDLFVFHQANAYILEEIRRILGIPVGKFQMTLSHCANTISSTIPIALKHAQLEGRLRNGTTVLVAGFGVGYSWAAAIVRWRS
jgi:3-oxoacyl-[acyl-carrier-protein] synthase III